MFVIKIQTMTQLERIHFIYTLLEEAPQTINQIHEQLAQKNVDLGARQLYLDLSQIEKYYLRKGEQLLCSSGQFNRKTYRLVKPSDEIGLTARDITTFQLARSASPRILQQNRKESMNKFRSVYKEFIKMNSTFYSFMSEEQNTRSFFYESAYDSAYDDKLDDIIWSIANYTILTIKEIGGDATSIPKKLRFPIAFKPLLLIFHRGTHFVAGYESERSIFLTIDISKIRDYSLTKRTFAFKKLVASSRADMQKRFGVTQNIDDKLYKIELEFASQTGEFVSHYFWHSSQQFRMLDNGNWLMSMECGINRELLGWIFQWMSNVRIRKPKILSNLYMEQLTKINASYDEDKIFSYHNFFTELS